MRDAIALHVDGKRIEHFVRYSIEADLYQAADAFSVDLANPGVRIAPGARCELRVNGELELTGIIDRVVPGYDKAGRKLTLEGRDLMGLVVDSSCELATCKTYRNTTLKALAEKLLATVPFISRKDIVYHKDAAVALKHVQVEPGQTVFDILRDAAQARGLMFFSLPDGTFRFDRPKSGSAAPYRLVTRLDGQGTKVKDATFYQDISRAYSEITVIGQQQGRDDLSAAANRTRATVTDPRVPFRRPLVVRNNNDDQSPARQARALLDKQALDAFQLFYRVAGHSQNGVNWRINELCRVQDEVFGVDGTYLIYNRVLEMSKEEGPVTWLKLGPPGVVA